MSTAINPEFDILTQCTDTNNDRMLRIYHNYLWKNSDSVSGKEYRMAYGNLWRGAVGINQTELLFELGKQGVIWLPPFEIHVNAPIFSYEEYIVSDEWKERAQQAKARAGQRCQVCNASREDVQLDTHHRTYERLGDEDPRDLIVLCRTCHTLFHEHGRLAKAPQ